MDGEKIGVIKSRDGRREMIVIIQTRQLEMLLPLISLLKTLTTMGERVVYLGLTDTPVARNVLKEIGVEHRIYNWPVITIRERPILRVWRELTKEIRPYVFRRWVWKQIDQIAGESKDKIYERLTKEPQQLKKTLIDESNISQQAVSLYQHEQEISKYSKYLDNFAYLVDFYDYLEIQPLGNNRFQIDSDKFEILCSSNFFNCQDLFIVSLEMAMNHITITILLKMEPNL